MTKCFIPHLAKARVPLVPFATLHLDCSGLTQKIMILELTFVPLFMWTRRWWRMFIFIFFGKTINSHYYSSVQSCSPLTYLSCFSSLSLISSSFTCNSKLTFLHMQQMDRKSCYVHVSYKHNSLTLFAWKKRHPRKKQTHPAPHMNNNLWSIAA